MAEEKKLTFIILKMPHPNGSGYVWMFHDAIGMLIGSVAGSGAKFGEDPNLAVSRAFLSDEHAKEWLKGQCRARWQGDIEFEEVDPQSRIVMAAPGDMSRLRQ